MRYPSSKMSKALVTSSMGRKREHSSHHDPVKKGKKRPRLEVHTPTEKAGPHCSKKRKRRKGNKDMEFEDVRSIKAIRYAAEATGERYTLPHYAAASKGKQTSMHNDVRGKGRMVNFTKPADLEGLLKAKVGHQVSTLVNNPSFDTYLKSSASDLTSVRFMMNIFDNTLFCECETLRKKAQVEVIPKLLRYRGFLEAIRYHLSCLPAKANVQERVSSRVFVKQICNLFEHILSFGDILLACEVLPLDTLWGATRQLSTQEMHFQTLHDKAQEILDKRDKVRQLRYDAALEKHVLNDVTVLPSKEELEQKTLPITLQPNIVSGPYRDLPNYLEVQYQLFREDFIHPLRCTLHDMECAEEEGQAMMVYNAEIKNQVYDYTSFEIRFEVPNDCHIRWDRTKRFSFGNLVCFISDTCGSILFATVAERQVEDLKRGLVTVDFQTNVDILSLPSKPYRMIESPGFYAAYAPILRHLKSLQENPTSLPFSKYIVDLTTDVECPKYISSKDEYTLNLHTVLCSQEHSPGETCPCKSVNILDKALWDGLPTPSLNESQKEALHSALTKELSIIQGPPGTGKTYTGLKIVEALIQNRASWDVKRKSTVLVVCYTNHALDQFLEGIIKQIGKSMPAATKVRRIGGRSKSELIKDYNIKEFALRHLRSQNIYGFWRRKNYGTRQIINALKDLERHEFDPHKLKHYTWFIGSEFWSTLRHKFLATGSIGSWLGLIPTSNLTTNYNTEEDDRRMAGEINPADEIIEEYGVEQLQEFFRYLSKVEALTESRANEKVCLPPHDIEKHVRRQLFKYFIQSSKESLEETLKFGQGEEEQYEEKRRLAMIYCLKQADIIGITTTLAARHNGILAEINTKVIIVEEAAEVLEAHTVSSLNRKTEHLILIGDHKQLRPKTNDHKLASEYHLNVSLFERLVRNNFPHVTLKLQHRMRPEISTLVSSQIYGNELKDAQQTMDYPHVAGLKHNVFFIDHSEPETTNVDLKSKTNCYEAEFLVKLCRYMLQQKKYNENQITVITPYTGQLFHLRDVFVNFKMPNVTITTIDAYQGEENDIILLSLVRSEMPGFVADKCRVCVALSRARHGLYVIGNFSKLFVHKCKLWRSLVNLLKSQKPEESKFGTSLPLECQGHKTLTLVSKPDDFDKIPDGGCSLPCNSRLVPCRHMCPLKCHPDCNTETHSAIECKEQCQKFCDQGHQCKKICSECKGNCLCDEIVEKIVPQCGHRQFMPCHTDSNKFTCQESCKKILSCGHRCREKCGEEHTRYCPELVTRMCPKKHEGRGECCVTNEDYSRQCKAKCNELLMCGHRCQGTCGECRQGRLHRPCKMKCERSLTCSHICASPCAENCPPCELQCPVICQHGPCDHTCFKPCSPCPHHCTRKCVHQKCSRLCGEICDCKPCDKPCKKKLKKCSHDCMGLCGEICPDVCRICDKDKFSEFVPLIFGTEDLEDKPDLKVIMLDCGHKFEVDSLDKYYNEYSQQNKIQWIECLLCKKPVFKVNRYKHLAIAIMKDMNKVKQKTLLLNQEDRKHFENKLKEIIPNTKLLRYPQMLLDKLELFSDNKLQNEYVVFYAEKCVKEVFDDIDNQYLSIFPPGAAVDIREHLKKLERAMTTLQNQKDDFVHKLERYRQFPLTEQVVCDIEAEQHRLQLVPVVIKIQAQIKVQNIMVIAEDQTELDDFLHKYEAGEGSVCMLKLSPSEYESSMSYLKDLERKYGLNIITREERQMIIRALNAKPGSWYNCPNGHVYNIGDCGGAMVESVCPECKSTIGGSRHRLLDDNTHAGEFDGSRHAAWSIGANMGNYEFIGQVH